MRKSELQRARAKLAASNQRHATAHADTLRNTIAADLEVVADAYTTAQTTLIELEKAIARIDAIAAESGSAAAVRAFRDLAAAQKDITGTLLALRAEGRATIRDRLAADPPSPVDGEGGRGGTNPPPKIFPSRATEPVTPETEENHEES